MRHKPTRKFPRTNPDGFKSKRCRNAKGSRGLSCHAPLPGSGQLHAGKSHTARMKLGTCTAQCGCSLTASRTRCLTLNSIHVRAPVARGPCVWGEQEGAFATHFCGSCTPNIFMCDQVRVRQGLRCFGASRPRQTLSHAHASASDRGLQPPVACAFLKWLLHCSLPSVSASPSTEGAREPGITNASLSPSTMMLACRRLRPCRRPQPHT